MDNGLLTSSLSGKTKSKIAGKMNQESKELAKQVKDSGSTAQQAYQKKATKEKVDELEEKTTIKKKQ